MRNLRLEASKDQAVGRYERAHHRQHFTVTEVSSKAVIDQWKAEQEERSRKAWQAKRARIVNEYYAGLLLDKAFGESNTTKAFKRHKQLLASGKLNGVLERNYPRIPKLSLYRRVLSYCIQLFLNLNFNRG